MAIVHSIGQPVNESEREAIAYFAQHLPDTYHLFHNLELPNHHGLPFEYDQIIVGELAIYVIEVKGYHGRINGNAQEWELENGKIDKSPIPLSNTKARVVAKAVHTEPTLRDVWVQSLIVLTNERASITLNDPQADRVLHLAEAVSYMLDPTRLPFPTPRRAYLIDLVSKIVFSQFGPLRHQNEIGDYRVLATIGKNNRYTSLLAEHRLIRTRNRFTLKVYYIDLFADLQARRKQEDWTLRDATALYMLAGHPNIVQAYQPFRWEDDKIVLPVEWIDGYSLRGLLDTQTIMNYSRALKIMRAICQGLSHAHSNGVIHRDIRPENIIIPHNEPVKLVNFDCARVKALGTIGGQVSQVLDEQYLAPELNQDASAASPATDLYAAGIILVEMLTGQHPYQQAIEMNAATSLSHQPTKVHPHLPQSVDRIVTHLCAYNARDRYNSAADVLKDLKRLIDNA